MSPIEAAATAIDIHNTASKWDKALLDNSARPSGALVYSARDGNLSVEQYDRLKAELEQGFVDAKHRSAMTAPPTTAGPSCSRAASTGSP
jgi:phage portal protein BeeE